MWLIVIIIIIVIIFLTWEFFTPVLADGFPFVFEWQHVSSWLQDFSQYSSRSQQCYNLDGLHSSSYYEVLQSFIYLLVTVPKALITIGIVTFMFHIFSLL